MKATLVELSPATSWNWTIALPVVSFKISSTTSPPPDLFLFSRNNCSLSLSVPLGIFWISMVSSASATCGLSSGTGTISKVVCLNWIRPALNNLWATIKTSSKSSLTNCPKTWNYWPSKSVQCPAVLAAQSSYPAVSLSIQPSVHPFNWPFNCQSIQMVDKNLKKQKRNLPCGEWRSEIRALQ